MNDGTEACFECGGTARAVEAPRRVKVGRRSVRIVDAFMQCDACGEEYYLPGQMEASQQRAAEALAAGTNALTPDEVRAAREGLGLPQVGLERLLGVGPKTVVRWERGTVRPNAATDRLLRLVRDVPGVAAYLGAEAGVHVGNAGDVQGGPVPVPTLRPIAWPASAPVASDAGERALSLTWSVVEVADPPPPNTAPRPTVARALADGLFGVPQGHVNAV